MEGTMTDARCEGVLRLVIVEQHPFFRDCLATVLAEDPQLEVVGKTGSQEEALGKLVESPVHVLLVGIDSSGDGVLDFIRMVGHRYPQVRILIVGREDSEGPVLEYLEAGADGYLLRDQSLAELRSAIETVSRGDKVCAPHVAQCLFSRLASLGRERRRRERLDLLTLTPRELEILRLIAEDLGNQEIARKLYLSVHTVKNHVHKILETLGVHSRWAAVRYALERGWLRKQ
jgi:DNA-binding NarL/FixJ family response regulator